MLLVESAVRSVVTKPIAEHEVPVYKLMPGRPDMDVNISGWSAEHAVFRFANAEHVVDCFQSSPIRVVWFDRNHRHKDVDDWFRGQPWNCRRSDVLDRDRVIAER